jgi:LAS superfamily LD-carboxypeptidase LdcB/peptidoglycan hydrolase-like protein with peptidoglycan-binding domain
MKNINLNESEKQYISKLHNLIIESGEIKSLPSNIQSSLKKLEKKINRQITDDDVRKELNQEKNWTKDNGGVDSKAKSQIDKLLSKLKEKFPNINAKLVSGYRSYDDQVSNFGGKVNSGRSFDNVQRAVTLPGFSQHHTGKAFDIISVEESWWDNNSDVEDWVKNNCGKFGFDVTYKTSGVLRQREPWHLYYVGGEQQTDDKPKKTVTNDNIDDYYSGTDNNPTFEKSTEKIFKKSSCKPINKYTEAPSIDEVGKSKNKVIRIGHTGESVRITQMFLKKLNYDLGGCGVDGLFGIKTKRAVEKFQEDEQINPVSSCIDLVTLEKLIDVTEKRKNPKTKDTETKKSNSKTNDKITNKSQTSETTTDREYIILKPKNYTGKNVHVLFAGRHTYEGGVVMSAMKSYIKKMEPYSNNSIIVITHCRNTVNNASEYINKKLGLKISSIAGFSQGGKHVWTYRNDSSFKIVGLIDPLIYEKNKTLGSNAYMTCNYKNWGGNKYTDLCREVLESYCENQKNYSGHIECPNVSHWNMLDYFYQKYGNRI